MKLLVATRNNHKLEEIREIFSLENVELVGMDSFPDVPEVVEDGKTFESNAVKKAVEVAVTVGMWTIADDSGLEVDALGGAPGIYSARYAGEHSDYSANNDKLLAELDGVKDRQGRFRCVVALSSPDGQAQIVEGKCEGSLIDSLQGVEGFGYDPLFVPRGFKETFAEMKSELKNSISHRAIAFNRARDRWGEMLSSGATFSD